MTDDRWRDGYDAWKLRSPDDEAARFDPLCHHCGSEDQTFHDDYGHWRCGDCIEEIDELASLLAARPLALEDLDERCGA